MSSKKLKSLIVNIDLTIEMRNWLDEHIPNYAIFYPKKNDNTSIIFIDIEDFTFFKLVWSNEKEL